MSTASAPSAEIVWYFFDEANLTDACWSSKVSERDRLDSLATMILLWHDALKDVYKFPTSLGAINFYQLKDAVPTTTCLNSAWRQTVSLDEVATRLSPATPVGIAVEGSHFPFVRLLVTAVRETRFVKSVAVDVNAINTSDSLDRRYNCQIDAAKSFIPCKDAKSSEFLRVQEKQITALYDGYYALRNDGEPTVITIAPPIEIYHPVFSDFLRNVRNQNYQPTTEAIRIVCDLMSTAGAIHNEEQSRSKDYRQFIGDLLDHPTTEVNRTASDGLITTQLIDCMVPLVALELNNALGEGGSDTLIQAELSVFNLWANDEFSRIRNRCCCPTFIVAGGGPYLCVLGVVWTDRFIVQRLTDIMWIGQATIYEDAHIHNLARVFTALRNGKEELQTFYETIDKQTDPELTPRPRFFPYPKSFQEYGSDIQTTFTYLKMLEKDSTNVTFLACTPERRKLVIKFVDRYGYDVHARLAAQGLAPKLLYCGSVNGKHDARTSEETNQLKDGLYLGPLRMVVMEYIQGRSAAEMEPSDWPINARTDVQRALSVLHSGGMVFGDLRQPNIMFANDGKTYLIDFDWSGKDGEARYPRNISQQIVWPEGVESFALIRQEHDLSLFDECFA